ncbi:MAG: cysteine desulfurase [Bacteroidetes bacterium]|nr:cysteine desulfurase [Bacteroidota bacterium]
MTRIYFDNAATTPVDPQVVESMIPFLQTHFGNPSSIYSYGREARLAIENARKSVAHLLGTKPGEIIFTSCGTESDNMAIWSAIEDLGCRHIITSPLEHHAVLHSVQALAKQRQISVEFLRILPNGHIDLADLERALGSATERCLVTLMHANNEIGNLLDIETVGTLCEKYNAIFHSDTVQMVGHYPIDLSKTKVHFATGAAHKFHGPKGIGILYIDHNVSVSPFIHGGGQERNMRAGTENVAGIVGFSKALELATSTLSQDQVYIQSLKEYLAAQLQLQIPGVQFNGDWNGASLYTLLNVSFPRTPQSEMLLMGLDMQGICVSAGSACSSGANQGSHVINALPNGNEGVPIRFSFSKFNTKEEVDQLLVKLKQLL